MTRDLDRPMDFWTPAIVDGARAAKRKAATSTTDALFELRQVQRATEAATRALVQHALDAGHTWAEIGAALGTSRQGAQQRYSDLSHPAAAVALPQKAMDSVWARIPTSKKRPAR